MWQFIAASVAGTSHVADTTPCQDAFRVESIHIKGKELLIVVCSDGAGSASHAQRGSEKAVTAGMGIVLEYLKGSELRQVCRSEVESWYSQIHDALNEEAKTLGIELSDLHCTLLIAILGQEHSVFAQLGDGAMVIDRSGKMEVVFWPQSGEFTSMTYFITCDDFVRHLEVRVIDESVSHFAAFTDGMERLVLNFSGRCAHEPFFQQMFGTVRSAEDLTLLTSDLTTFLNSQHVNERTNDDKTLVLAVRRNESMNVQQQSEPVVNVGQPLQNESC
jgi:hypothetical protein